MKKHAILTAQAILILTGCANTTATEKVAGGAKETLSGISQSISKECMTESIKTQIKSMDIQIDNIVTTCNTEKAQMKAEHKNQLLIRDVIIGALAGIILLYFVARTKGVIR